MRWPWILAVAVLMAVLLLRTRVGVGAAFGGGALRLDVKIGLLRARILPAKPKKPRAKRAAEKKKPPRKEPEAGKETPKRGLSFTLEDGKDALRTLFPALRRTLGRVRRGIRIKPLRLSLVLGGQEDPAASAQRLGELQAAVWAGMPLLEELLDIRDPHVHTSVDFSAAETAAEGEIGVTFRIGTLLAAGFGLAFPALGWFLRWRKRCKTRPAKPGKGAEAPPSEDPPPEEHPAA